MKLDSDCKKTSLLQRVPKGQLLSVVYGVDVVNTNNTNTKLIIKHNNNTTTNTNNTNINTNVWAIPVCS